MPAGLKGEQQQRTRIYGSRESYQEPLEEAKNSTICIATQWIINKTDAGMNPES
jgi:hypothetical protein